MAKATAPVYIVGNWKMNKTIEEALNFVDTIAPTITKANSTVMLAVPYTAIKSLSDKTKETKVIIGAQNMNAATTGAFTGEVAALMLKDAGAQFVLLGHSERRKLFAETNEVINKKVKKALESNLQPILCIGEEYEDHQAEKTQEVLKKQLEECLADIDKSAMSSLIIAYEPVWAIGTGMSLDAEAAGIVHKNIRLLLEDLYGKKQAQAIPVIYGGSVNLSNAKSFLATEGVDGLLIGSASLHPETFAKIIELGQNGA